MECYFKNSLLLFGDKNNQLFMSGCCLQKPKPLDDNDFLNKSLQELGFLRKASDRSGIFNCKNKCEWDDVKIINIGILHFCNIHCYHCCSEIYKKPNIDCIQKVFERLLSFKGLLKIELDTSGEIFTIYTLLKNFLRRLDPSITKEVVLLTNGLLLDENKLYELKQISINTGVNYSFRVSVDGITKETYEKTRIGGTFEKIIKNISLIKDNFPIQISFTIKKTNYSDAYNVKSFFNQLGFYNIFITADVYDPDMQDVLSELDQS